MAEILDLTLTHYDMGQRVDEYYFLSNFTIPIGSSIVLRVVAKYATKAHLNHCLLEESLSLPEKIIANTAEYTEIANEYDSLFLLDTGAYYLRVTNTSLTEPAQINISCI